MENLHAFINAAYVAILGRSPDPDGFAHYMARLSAGVDSRVILDEIYMSPEAETRRALSADDLTVRGLKDLSARADGVDVATRDLAHIADSPADIFVNNETGQIYELERERMRHAYYVRLIHESSLFDDDYYLSNYDLPNELKHHPVLHFVLIGEERGWQPNADFSPDAYLQFNADIVASGIRPFMHFLQVGRTEKRVYRFLAPVAGGLSMTPLPNLRGRAFARPHKIAFCVHIYYDDLWAELKESISRLREPADLFVSITDRGPGAVPLRQRIFNDYPDARVFIFPNHGRDIFPFVYMATAGLFDAYDAVCKIHTKKSPHREDGDKWRNHLIDGVLPWNSDQLLRHFLDDREAGVLIADGQIFEGEEWWGSNKTRVLELLRRNEIEGSGARLRFPAGSMYWVKQPIINLIRGMQLTSDDFETENNQIDGTTAHSFERTLGYLSDAVGLELKQTSEAFHVADRFDSKPIKPFVSCFYLPQFHRIAENDLWWGSGYTEWTGVVNARPQYAGHNQPVLPLDFGFYDLRMPEVFGEQYAMAKAHGIDAFCVYYYSFDHGKRLLQQPLDNVLQRQEIESCFYLCWANESWTRNWDGLSGEILIAQNYLEDFEKNLAEDSARYFRDDRYYKHGGTAPRFVIYRPDDIPSVRAVVLRLRKYWKDLGFPEVHLGAVLFHLNDEMANSLNDLFDFFLEMPPHGLVGSNDFLGGKNLRIDDFPVSQKFQGLIYSYDAVVKNSLRREFASAVSDKVIRGVMPSWDNTARRGNSSHISYGANPGGFGRWVKALSSNANTRELIVNSWNEWGEKAMLEPSRQYGLGYLRALKAGLGL